MRRALAGAILAACAGIVPGTAFAADSSETLRLQPPLFVVGSSAPNMLGTTAVSIRADRFNGSLANALQDATSSPLLQRLVSPARTLNPLQQIAYVQSRVHNSIRWISDATEWGRHDYWATAAQTLAKGAGDQEDRAIVKMHALRALGFKPDDLFLTLARDRVSGPITVLSVRLDRRFYILDDTGGTPFLVDTRSRELQPFLSFGWHGAWAHTKGAPRSTPVAALRAPRK
jgi:predicted transglutaminase-like cysteine proteinase